MTKFPQILAMLGNRTVVFGESDDKGPIAFSPEKSSLKLPRVASFRDMPAARLEESLRVDECKIVERRNPLVSWGDLILEDHHGNRILVELKLSDGSPSHRELERFREELLNNVVEGMPAQIWQFSSDPLSLVISGVEQGKLCSRTLIPLNVWEATDGGFFDRARVVDRVNEWEARLGAFFSQIEEWVNERPSLRVEKTRNVTMSEEMMRDFAVEDRDLPILDVLEKSEAVASFVPRALWLIGADGRVDLITRSGTDILVYESGTSSAGWKLVDRSSRTQLRDFDKAVFFDLLEAQ